MKINQYLYLNDSDIHHKGVFARRRISKGIYIIEYVGPKVTKDKSKEIEKAQLEHSEKNPSSGAVYTFELDDNHDIDGDVPYNHAKYINHSCDPNCEIAYLNGKIFIRSSRDIKKGEEVSYNYGFDMEDYEKHPCKCGAGNCIGYILDKYYWGRIRK
jgi:uncharacterized protein